ncbi:MAG: hypothetical protein RQ757_03195 [Pseudomonadales bacterium]|nr:hypothetical protein [Pseudomonadales bacterium]
MQLNNSILFIFTAALITALTASSATAQGIPLPVELLPLGKDIGIAQGQTVTPAYEGWYTDDEGNIALSFGYYNRNTQQVLEIPVGSANRIIGAPADQVDQGQPTHFEPGRHWGTFVVSIPPDYGEEVVWHLENQGKTFHIPANRDSAYVIDAIAGDANGNFPPTLRFAANGPGGQGPKGITSSTYHAKVGMPLTIEVWANDDGIGSGLPGVFMASRGDVPPMNLRWIKHQGSGSVNFSETVSKVPVESGKASTQATFTQPGDYLLRVEVNEFTGMQTAGHSQCCWTNGFVRVEVSR